jgi:hypothetical protein
VHATPAVPGGPLRPTRYPCEVALPREDHLPPFRSERAAARAPEILRYCALAGGAFLISPSGAVSLRSGSAMEIDTARVARVALARASRHRGDVLSFVTGRTCVYAAAIGQGWTLCVLSTLGAQPVAIIERLRRASRVLALALVDGSPGGPVGSPPNDGGAPAEVFAARLLRRGS